MSSRKVVAKRPRRVRRTSSNVFAMFDQTQIQEFKEAFNLIDQNRDGFIDKEDLLDMLNSLGIVICGSSPGLLLPKFILRFNYCFWKVPPIALLNEISSLPYSVCSLWFSPALAISWRQNNA